MRVKIYKRILVGVFVLLLVFLPMTVEAAGSIDPEREVSLTISYQQDETPLTGAQFDIYLVAVMDECGELTPTDDFAQFDVQMRGKNDEEWKTLASSLEDYILRENLLPADSGKTDSRGLLTFPARQQKLQHGLYLVLGHRHSQGGYQYGASSLQVLLPGPDIEANDWIYNVTAYPKYDYTNEGRGEEPDRPVHLLPSGKLPQTGQLWWPVPILFAVGVFLLVSGLICQRNRNYEE